MSTPEQGLSSTTPIKVNKWLEASTFNSFHFRMFVACLIVMALDGYDLYVIGAALPILMKAFALTVAQAGTIVSATSLGTFLGGMFLAPFGDKVGRRKVVLSAVVVACLSMTATALSHGFTGFMISRLVFGAANAVLTSNVMALVSEYVPGKSRQTFIGLVASGMQVGGMSGALMGILLFANYGWRPVFFIAAAPIVLFPLYLRWMPESSSFLARNNRLNEVRNYLRKSQPTNILPENAVLEVEKGRSKLPLAEVFKEHRAIGTLLFWVCDLINTYVNYSFTFWLPKLMMNKGFSMNRSISFMFSLSITAIVMTFIAGRISDRVGAKPVLSVLFLLSCVSIGAIAYTNSYMPLMILTGLAGAGLNGAQNMFNSYSPSYYPPPMRSTVMAYNFTSARVGGIIGPVLVGLLLSAHISTATTMLLIGLPNVLSAIAIAFISEKYNYTRMLAAAQ